MCLCGYFSHNGPWLWIKTQRAFHIRQNSHKKEKRDIIAFCLNCELCVSKFYVIALKTYSYCGLWITFKFEHTIFLEQILVHSPFSPWTLSLAEDLFSPMDTVTSQSSPGWTPVMVRVWSVPSEVILYLSEGEMGWPLMNHWTGASSSSVEHLNTASVPSLTAVSSSVMVNSAGTAEENRERPWDAFNCIASLVNLGWKMPSYSYSIRQVCFSIPSLLLFASVIFKSEGVQDFECNLVWWLDINSVKSPLSKIQPEETLITLTYAENSFVFGISLLFYIIDNFDKVQTFQNDLCPIKPGHFEALGWGCLA